MRRKGECPRCGVVTRLTRHHIIPKRNSNCDGITGKICRSCHDQLEHGITTVEKTVGRELPIPWYQAIWESFIGK